MFALRPARSLLALILLAAPLALPAAALARDAADDEVVSTAARAAKPPTEAELAKAQADAKVQADAARAAKPVTTQEQVAAWLAASPPIERVDNGPVGYSSGPADETAKRQVHGSMGVSVGTGGYRSAYASTLIPVGETGTLGIAVSQTDYGKHGRAYGYGYGDPLGYGGYGDYGDYGGYGGWGARGGRSQSVALSLDMTGGRGKSGTPEGCAPGFRDGDRYVEPVWVTQMRGDRACAAAADRP
ncbi:hypothetical protein [Caulobacter sp. LARHSG274]